MSQSVNGDNNVQQNGPKQNINNKTSSPNLHVGHIGKQPPKLPPRKVDSFSNLPKNTNQTQSTPIPSIIPVVITNGQHSPVKRETIDESEDVKSKESENISESGSEEDEIREEVDIIPNTIDIENIARVRVSIRPAGSIPPIYKNPSKPKKQKKSQQLDITRSKKSLSQSVADPTKKTQVRSVSPKKPRTSKSDFLVKNHHQFLVVTVELLQ